MKPRSALRPLENLGGATPSPATKQPFGEGMGLDELAEYGTPNCLSKSASRLGFLTSPEGRDPHAMYYQGDYRDGKFHGKGFLWFPNNEIYSGSWQYGKRDGVGRCEYANGDTYAGQWVEGKYHGYGVYRYKSGHIYAGTWRKCKRHGRGVFVYPDQVRVFEGIFVDGFFSSMCDAAANVADAKEMENSARRVALEIVEKVKDDSFDVARLAPFEESSEEQGFDMLEGTPALEAEGKADENLDVVHLEEFDL